MTDATTNTRTLVIQCPFCEFVNWDPTPNARCNNCGIGLARLLTPPTAAETSAPRPEIKEPPADPSPVKMPRVRKPKRRRKTAAADGLPWLANAISIRPEPDAAPATPQRSGADDMGAPRPDVTSTPLGPTTSGVAPHDATPPMSPVAPVAAATFVDEELEATVLHQATPAAPATPVSRATWVLELETGETFLLDAGDIVVGRHPSATDGATPLRLPDPSRTLSRTHARLRHDTGRDMWTIEDLGSSNGVATFNSDTGTLDDATPGHPTDVAEYLRIGTLKARLRRDTATSPNDAT